MIRTVTRTIKRNARPGRTLGLVAAVALLSTSTGCLGGAIYKHTTVPLDVDFDSTPVHDGGRGESWKTLVIPIFYRGQSIQFDWGDMSTRNALEEAGIDVVHYADLETRQFLGIWSQRWLHVYGEAATPAD